MKPYWQSSDGSEVWHGDTLQVLAALRAAGRRFGTIIMDPPFASGTRTETSKATSGAMVRGQRWADRPIDCDQMTTTGFIWLMRETALAVREMLPEGASLFCFIDWRMWPHLVGAVESCNLRVNTMIVWDKLSLGMGACFRNQHELILHASKGTARVAERNVPNVLRYPRADDEHHPSPKPPELIVDLLRCSTAPGTEVLDPYMGGGATLVAGKLLRRPTTGIDMVRAYCDDTIARLGAVTAERARESPGPLFEGRGT
jgi:site-specific DNA-methyltransferase (adenine-specific)